MSSFSEDTRFTTGAIVAVTQTSDGEYTCKQVVNQDRIPNAPQGSNIVIPLSWSAGPLNISGQIDTDTLGIQASITVFGIGIGSFSGNLKDGVSINVDLFIVKGNLTVFLKNGNEVWVKYSLNPTFGSSINNETKILTLPI